MRNGLVPLVIAASLWTTCALAQAPSPAPAPPMPDSSVLAGTWTYRSFHNNPTPVGNDPNRALHVRSAVEDNAKRCPRLARRRARPAGHHPPRRRRCGADGGDRRDGPSWHRDRRLGIRLLRPPGAQLAQRRRSGAGIRGQRHTRQAARRLAGRLRRLVHRREAALRWL
jgi:hypothetical protein